MPRLAALGLVALIPVALVVGPAWAQIATTNSTGSVGCAAITQAAANGMTSRVGADDTTIRAPQSVTQLSCLDNFFNGVGLNLVTNLLNPGTLLQAVEGQICSLVQSTWSSMLGSAQCGLTLTGFNLGLGGIGGGLSCPSLILWRRRAADRLGRPRLGRVGRRALHQRQRHGAHRLHGPRRPAGLLVGDPPCAS